MNVSNRRGLLKNAKKPDGTPLTGKLGRDLDANEGYQAARQIA